MSKRGTSALAIFLVVLLFAIIGLLLVLSKGASTSGAVTQDHGNDVKLTVLECQSKCFGARSSGKAGRSLSGPALQDCVRQCQEAAGVTKAPSANAYH